MVVLLLYSLVNNLSRWQLLALTVMEQPLGTTTLLIMLYDWTLCGHVPKNRQLENQTRKKGLLAMI